MVARLSAVLVIVFCVLALGASTLAGVAHAGPPAQEVKPADGVAVYAGHLATADGQVAPDGVYGFRFELYDEPADGQLLWSETVDDVPVAGSSFSATLGNQNPLPETLLGQKLWLAVAVRGPSEPAYTELAPRQAFAVDAPAEMAAISALTCPHTHWAESWGGNNGSYGLIIDNNGTGDGLRAYSNATASNFAAVYAYNTATTGGGRGVYARSERGAGVYGYSADDVGMFGQSAGNDGVRGQTSTTNKSGVYGVNYGKGYGAFGRSSGSFGLGAEGGGDASPWDTVGDLLLGGNRAEVFTFGQSMNLYSNGDFYIDLDNDNNDSNAVLRIFNGTDNVVAEVRENGTKSAVLQTASYGARAVYTMESPEVWLEDFGSAELVDGAAAVAIDPIFAEMINLNVEYHVFVTPLGECQGLYVTDKGPAGFTVKELGGGAATLRFDYRIVAKRIGLEDVRTEQVGAADSQGLK